MRRRLTLSIVGVVAAALVVSGLVSILLVGARERHRVEQEVTREAQGLAAQADRVERPAVLLNLGRFLRLRDLRLVRVTAAGQVQGALPVGVRTEDIRPADLLAGGTVHGRRLGLAFAAAPVSTPRGDRAAFVLTRRAGLVPGITPYFLLSSALALLVAAVVGDQLGRRIARPLQAAELATRRIAAGELDAPVPVPTGADPELASLARSINTMAETLARSRGLERQFLLSVSHDLRTPLTSIRGFAEAIADGAATDTRRAAEVIAAESRRLERLVRDLLELAKLDARRFSLDLRRVDLGEVVTDTAEGFRPAAAGYDLALAVAPVPAPLAVTADPDRLAQVVANLVENALKFATGRISVGAYPHPLGAAVVVEDDGPGIAGTDLPNVFQRLYTTSRAPARQVGSGLGLAIVAELVTAMGGTVEAQSPIGPAGGTRVVVALRPWGVAATPPPPVPSPSGPSGGEPPTWSGTGRTASSW